MLLKQVQNNRHSRKNIIVQQFKTFKNVRFKNLAETLVNLTVKDVNELAAILKDEYGIEPAAAAVVVAGGGAADAAEERLNST